MNQILISQLRLEAIVGVYPEERLAPQSLVLDMALTVDTQKAAQSDHVADAMDYDVLIKNLQQWTADTAFQLIETLAHYLAEKIITTFNLVQDIHLTVYKFPKGLPVDKVGVAVFLSNQINNPQ